MKRYRTHQIDELARRVLQDALPPTWVVNPHHNDYAKDYLVEIGENSNELTGSSFYIQLKGHEKTKKSPGGSVKQSLESRHAKYYSDKVKDLPVFLVVVDVTKKLGWWLFLQPVLAVDKKWKTQKSVTINVPLANGITNTAQLRKAVDDAKKWLRLNHPESIFESVMAHKSQLSRIDPRFDFHVSLKNDRPIFRLSPKMNEDIQFRFTFMGNNEEIERKVRDLIDKGKVVHFLPGELKIEGTKIFDQLEQTGCVIQSAFKIDCMLTLVCRNTEGNEIGRLTGIRGEVAGGRKEFTIQSSLPNSPLTIIFEPVANKDEGSVNFTVDFEKWNGQRLRQLAYFEQLSTFFSALTQSSWTTIECETNGNRLFAINGDLQEHDFASSNASILGLLSKARKLAERFNVNPVWQTETHNSNSFADIDMLYGVCFENGWRRASPRVRVTAKCPRSFLKTDVAKKLKKPSRIKVETDCDFDLFGVTFGIGTLAYVYNQMCLTEIDDATSGTANGGRLSKSNGTSDKDDLVQIAFVGTDKTVTSVHAVPKAATST